MAIGRDEVLYGYRYILNREPESEQAIIDNEAAADWRSLREAMLASNEFQTGERVRFTCEGMVPIGRHMDVSEVSVEVAGTQEQLQAMLDRIASSWREFGEAEPFFSVITNDAFRADQLEQNLPDFLSHGRYDIERMLNFVRRAGLPDRFDRAMDFGCGVGRLTVPLSRYCRETVGVDISAGHLREARMIVEHQKASGIDFVEIGAVSDLDALGAFDLVITRLVLQHNPPPVMAAILGKLLARLRRGGVAVVQLPTFIKGQRFVIEEYLESPLERMEMNALPQSDIFRIVANQGCRVLEVREDDHLGTVDGLSHMFAIIKES